MQRQPSVASGQGKEEEESYDYDQDYKQKLRERVPRALQCRACCQHLKRCSLYWDHSSCHSFNCADCRRCNDDARPAACNKKVIAKLRPLCSEKKGEWCPLGKLLLPMRHWGTWPHRGICEPCGPEGKKKADYKNKKGPKIGCRK